MHPKTQANLLMGVLAEQGWSPQAIDDSATEPGVLLEQCLRELQRLREGGRAELSLRLLSTALQLGISSPWLEDSRARSLLALGDRQAANKLWSDLRQSGEQGVAAAADHALGSLEENPQEVLAADPSLPHLVPLGGYPPTEGSLEAAQRLLGRLRELCTRHGWMPRHLPEGDPGPDDDLTLLCLEEVIAARNGDQAGLSLELAECALKEGVESGWLLDNQARALVHLEREAEAVVVWRSLEGNPDPSLAAAATEMLSLYAPLVEKRQICGRVSGLLSGGETDPAVDLLMEAIVRDPGQDDYRTLLVQAIAQQEGNGDRSPVSSELRERQLQLEANSRVLELLAQRLGLSLP